MKEIKLFFWDVASDESINGDNPIAVSLNEALKRFKQLSKEDGSFIGFEFDENWTVQFMYDSNENLFLDVIDPTNDDTYGKNVGESEAINIIQDVYSGKNPMDIKFLNSDDAMASNETTYIDQSFGEEIEQQTSKTVQISVVLFCVLFLIIWYIFRDWGNPFTNLSAFIQIFMFTCGVGIPIIAIIIFFKNRIGK